MLVPQNAICAGVSRRGDEPPGEEARGRMAAALGTGAQRLTCGPLSVVGVGGSTLADGGSCVVVDGRLHNRAQLAVELSLAPAAGDAEVVWAAWQRWEAAALGRLRGEFALLLWDSARRRGLAAVDHMACRALYMRAEGDVVFFASEPHLLARCVGRGLSPDPIAVADWLAAEPGNARRTMFAEATRIPAGEWLALGSAPGLATSRYWDAGAGAEIALADAGADELAQELRAHLVRAVRRRLDPSGPTGVMLSGGIDSSAVACLAPAGGLRSYSAVFPGRPMVDEGSLIGELVAHIRATPTRVVVRSGSVVAGVLGHIARWGLPPTSPNLFFWEPLLARARDDGIRVLLDGEGGDELFGLAPYLIADRLRAGRLLDAYRLVTRGNLGGSPPPRIVLKVLRDFAVRGAAPYIVHERARARRAARDGYGPAWLRPELARARFEAADPWAWKRRSGPRWRAHLSAAITGAPSAAAYEHVRRRAADFGLFASHPLVDPDVIEFVLRLPPELAYDPHISRPLFRQSLAGVVPDSVRLRATKSNFNGPFHDSLLTTDREVVRSLLLDPGARILEYTDSGQLRTLVEAAPRFASQADVGWYIYVWRLVTAELWLRHLAGDRLEPIIAKVLDRPVDLNLES